MDNRSPKGSLWRKWDLHFHTPASFDYANKAITNAEIIQGLVNAEISVVAITDHHKIDVLRIKELQRLGREQNVTVLPGIELRSDKGGSTSVHFIGIFSEESDLESLWDKIKGQLDLTDADLKKIGDDAIYCNLEKACNLFHELGGIVSIHAGGKQNSIECITNSLPEKIALKKDILEDIDIFEMGQVVDIETYKQKVFPNIHKHPPMIICSDNHNINKYNLKASLWIKADATFEGLKQTIIEPADRVFIGDIPPAHTRVMRSPTRYIEEIKITKLANTSTDEIWFEQLDSIPLNNELVAIIGNKGSGKSALTDILGLLGNTHNYTGFSFLTDQKFRKKRPNRSECFEAKLMWADGSKEGPILLSQNPDRAISEKVKYIPQSFLEKLCNESDEETFEKELKDVIFSHLPDEEKLGKHTIEELIEYRSEEIQHRIDSLLSELSEINKKIVNLETKDSEDYSKQINADLATKNLEFIAHEKTKPARVDEPEKNQLIKQEHQEAHKQLTELKERLSKVVEDKKLITKEKKELTIKSAELAKLLEALKNFERQYLSLKDQFEPILTEHKIEFNDVVQMKIDRAFVQDALDSSNNRITDINNQLDSEFENGFSSMEKSLKKEIKVLTDKLDAPAKQFQEYLEKMEQWESTRDAIIGEKTQPGTLEFCKEILRYIEEDLKNDLGIIITQRKEKTIEIYKEKVAIIKYYQKLYEPITAFIGQYGESMKGYEININAELRLNNFESKFYDFINQAAKGTFLGKNDGANMLKNIIDGVDFNAITEVMETVNNIIENLNFDKRDGYSNEKRVISRQLKQGSSVQEFYDFIFGLKYLNVYYKLKLGKKHISELSPGERGALLLIFYLIIDKQDIPLIIDQPEENLDNQSVFNIIVKFIKDAKKRRQIIIVTHNPNLAVVCDAEQIIWIQIEKDNKNRVTCLAGALENPEINAKVVEILEGTFPAFDNRTEKYKLSRI